MTTPAIHTIVEMLESLPQVTQKQVAEHLKHYLAENRVAPKGKAGRQVLRFAGLIPPRDLEQMKEAIETGCEQVDVDEW